MKVNLVAGARPNFMKIAPILDAMDAARAAGVDISYRLVHTGQHYDRNMSGSFFKELGIPEPDANIGAGGGTQAEQTAAIMVAFERELEAHPADLVLVVGDVTSTMACAIVAKKMGTRVAHVEAGIRSFDLSMPEEINRMVTDCLTDYFFTTSETANQNLRRVGVPEERIFFVGNVMIDTLLKHMPRFRRPAMVDGLGLGHGKYLVLTLHRPANVDDSQRLAGYLDAIAANVNASPVVWPIHPRSARTFKELGRTYPNLHTVAPMGYLEFNYLVKHAKAVITDSGGVTEEATVMGVPCMTLRDNTERPETCAIGTNELVGTDPRALQFALDRLYRDEWKKGSVPEKWDGRAAERILEVLACLPLEVTQEATPSEP